MGEDKIEDRRHSTLNPIFKVLVPKFSYSTFAEKKSFLQYENLVHASKKVPLKAKTYVQN